MRSFADVKADEANVPEKSQMTLERKYEQDELKSSEGDKIKNCFWSRKN